MRYERDGIDLPVFSSLNCGTKCFENGRVRIKSGSEMDL